MRATVYDSLDVTSMHEYKYGIFMLTPEKITSKRHVDI